MPSNLSDTHVEGIITILFVKAAIEFALYFGATIRWILILPIKTGSYSLRLLPVQLRTDRETDSFQGIGFLNIGACPQLLQGPDPV